MKYARLTVNLTPELAAKAQARAAADRRSFANYVSGLIEKDLGLLTEEAQSPYGQLLKTAALSAHPRPIEPSARNPIPAIPPPPRPLATERSEVAPARKHRARSRPAARGAP